MIVVKVPFVEELLKYMLLLASGSPVMILRKGRRIFILTEIGDQPLLFVSKIPRSVPSELEAIYREITHGKFVFLDESGRIVTSDEIPQSVTVHSGVGMILDIEDIWISGGDSSEAIMRMLASKKRKKTD